MIVKIRCDKKWIFYDNFEGVRYEFIQNDLPHPETDINWHGSFLDKKDAPLHDIYIVGRKRDGTEFSIGANQDIYLCNDQGETIEKIH